MQDGTQSNLIARVMSKHVCHILFIIVMSQAPRLHSMVHCEMHLKTVGDISLTLKVIPYSCATVISSSPSFCLLYI